MPVTRKEKLAESTKLDPEPEGSLGEVPDREASHRNCPETQIQCSEEQWKIDEVTVKMESEVNTSSDSYHIGKMCDKITRIFRVIICC